MHPANRQPTHQAHIRRRGTRTTIDFAELDGEVSASIEVGWADLPTLLRALACPFAFHLTLASGSSVSVQPSARSVALTVLASGSSVSVRLSPEGVQVLASRLLALARA